ncbi:DUF1223 domain-containing protein [Cognatishimia sp. WU-CL00825]|uniref:DUF1223 domain-containing protein n=1 Tax=Cognatishimia sp. WU-CL00825 TaxID=3127658 RepID=UPI003106E463
MIRITRMIAAAMLGTLSGIALPVMAAEHPVVVELYTSQGCSSCPPADAYFNRELANRDDVIALALHVDYWDYIGWKDDFADPAYTKRQRNYAKAAGKRSIYTPQMVIGGLDHVVGNVPRDVKAHLNAHAGLDAGIDLDISRKGDRLTIALQAQEALDVPMTVQVVRYTKEEIRNIKRGENAGRTLTYTNIVTSWDTIGEWNTRRAKTMKTKVKGDSAVVVLVQRKGFGRIVAAALLR